MDSLTQLVLGAAVSVAVMRRRTAVWKAALWGGVAGTLPDLDVLVSHGDPILNMVLHRAESHALFWLTLFSVPFGWLVARVQGQMALLRWWWLAMWLALITHPLLDAFTVYGTQLLLPFSNHPVALGSVFIIDPAVTLPWLVGLAVALVCRGDARGQRANLWGLAVGTAVLLVGVGLQARVDGLARTSLAQQGVVPERVLVTPAPLSMLLWRVVAVQGDAYHEGFHGLLDAPGPMHFVRHDRGARHEAAVANIDGAQRIRRFSHGFYKLHESAAGRLVITDLRMGQEPHYSFAFAVARRGSPFQALPVAQSVGGVAPIGPALTWLARRIRGDDVAPPR
ncbi:MAG TPA: metal-dependent hydrolase [Ottowia sp.]|uniref:metal-dependent hydrolase n=1 Tax=Ottowia sp. TaxID=1898956 RepID=UPI002D061C2C|nr:metal-dependent hydrolase [Ottowia sp.]HMN21479.1 metal-dependent hydrolase [Ottowia sp.]